MKRFFFLGVSALLLCGGCQRPATVHAQQPATTTESIQAPQRAASATIKPVRKTFTHRIEAPGEVHADEQTPILAKITGYAKKVHKDIGDRVEAGDLLAELSVPEMEEELRQKEALVAQAKAEAKRAEQVAKAAQAKISYATSKDDEARAAISRSKAELSRAESQYERLKKSTSLISEDAIAELKLGYEAARAAVEERIAKSMAASATVTQSQAELAIARADIAVAEAKLKVAEAAAKTMSEVLAYATLKAPFDGVITRRNVDTGHFVQSSAAGSKSEPLFLVTRMHPVRVYVDIPENDATLIENKTKAVVRVQAIKGEQFDGAVKRSSWALDPKSRILRTEIDLPNHDGRLRPGMYAYATLLISHENVWAVPASAVVSKDNQRFVQIVADGQTRLVPVLTGLTDGNFVEIRSKANANGAWVGLDGSEEIVPAP